MKTTINQALDTWVLCIQTNEQLYKSLTFEKLIDAIDCASMLQLHVDNIDDLPLPQYKVK